MNDGIHYKNGDWLGAKDMNLSVFDLSVTRGIAVFDYLRTYNKKPFMLRQHYQRLINSAGVLNIDIDFKFEEITSIINKGIKKNSTYDEFGIRMIITAGTSPKQGSLLPGKPVLIMLFEEFEDPPKAWYENGLKLKTINSVRILPSAKTADYKLAFIGMNKARESGMDDVLYVDENNCILESSTSNIFCVKNSVLFTPKLDVLGGITRGLVIEIAKQINVKVEENCISLDDALESEEIFATATNKEIVPVGYINNSKIGDHMPGGITQKLHSELKKYINKVSS